MKELFLIRHAKSSWTDDALRDIDRPLNKRGRRQVKAMAAPLRELGALDGPVYASHACRARETIEGILEQVGDSGLIARTRFDPALYTFRWKRLLAWMKNLDHDDPTLTVIGHNPALTDLAAVLTGSKTPDMATGAVLHLRVPADGWPQLRKGKAELIRYLPPTQASYSLFQRKAPRPPVEEGALKQQVPAMLNHLLGRLISLQPGVMAGMDPEFLHQFRISLRRSRAIAEALQTITGDETLGKGVKPLKHMARQTSTLRDLDVFLMYLEERSASDARLRQSLRASGALNALRQWRDNTRQEVCEQLGKKAWHKQLKQWEGIVTGKGLARPLKKVDGEAIEATIHQRADQCLLLFRQLDSLSPDEDFHQVRKQLKRLRYLAELDRQAYQPLLAELKTLQKLYGEFQDRHVQLELMATLASARKDRRLPPTLAQLADQLEEDKREARDVILAHPPRLLYAHS